MADSGFHRGLSPQESDAKPPYERRYRWVMLALVWLSYFSFALVSYSLAPLVTPVLQELGISYSRMGIIMGAWPLTYIAVAAIGGVIMDRWGIRKSIFVGLVFIGLSEVLRYFASGFATLFLFVAIFGLGGPMISIGSPKTISMWFKGRERGTAVGIYLTGPWVGGAIMLSLMNSTVMPLVEYNWRMAFLLFGLLVFVVAAVWWVLARDVKESEAGERAGIGQVFRGLISVRNVQLVIVMGFLSFAVGHGFNDWLPKILETGGLTAAAAGLSASLPTWISVPTVVLVPRMIAPHLRGRTVALLSLATGAAMLIIASTSGVSRTMGLVLYGLSYSSVLPLLVLVLMDLPEVGSRYMGSASGMFFCVAEIGGFLGPFMVGFIKDAGGEFLGGVIFLAGLSFIRILFALMVRIRQPSLAAESVK